MPEKRPDHDPKCESSQHNEHLCYFVSQGFHLTEEREYKSLVNDPHFKCRKCGRVAHCAESLCQPTNL